MDNGILPDMDVVRYRVDTEGQYTPVLSSILSLDQPRLLLATSRGCIPTSALSPGQARAQPEPSPSPVVRLGLEISDARAHKTRAQTWALSPVRARTTLHGSTMHLRSPSLRLTSSQCCGSFMWYHGRNSVSALLGHSIHTLRPFSPPSSTVWPESRLLTRIALRVGIPECRYVLQ